MSWTKNLKIIGNPKKKEKSNVKTRHVREENKPVKIGNRENKNSISLMNKNSFLNLRRSISSLSLKRLKKRKKSYDWSKKLIRFKNSLECLILPKESWLMKSYEPICWRGCPNQIKRKSSRILLRSRRSMPRRSLRIKKKNWKSQRRGLRENQKDLASFTNNSGPFITRIRA